MRILRTCTSGLCWWIWLTAAFLCLSSVAFGAGDEHRRDTDAQRGHDNNARETHERRTPPATRDHATPATQRENRTPAVQRERTNSDTHHDRAQRERHEERRPNVEERRTPPAAPTVRHTPPVHEDRRFERQPGHNRAPEFRTPDRPVHNVYPPPARHNDVRITRYPSGHVETFRGPNRTEARFHTDGHVRILRTPERTIYRSSLGSRTVFVERPGNRVIVSHGFGHGYVQRPFVVHNHAYVQRTYYVNNAVYVHHYRPYMYRGITLHVYTPSRYYAPGFYGWVYSPWYRPVVYRWGWTTRPWYGYYGGYFAPYPVYSHPSLWLTDFLVAATLEAAYEERMAAAREARWEARTAYAGGPTTLTPEVKEAISREVQLQLDAERADAQYSASDSSSDGLPPAFHDGRSHVFVVSRSLDVPNLSEGGGECVVTEGDVLGFDGRLPGDADAADVTVLASKGQDCRKGSRVSVGLQDLIEMQNEMRATIDRGLDELRSKQGHGGLPALPSSAQSTPTQASYLASAPPPESNVASDIRREAEQANDAEQQVINDAAAPQSENTAAPPSISLGQTVDEVVGILGQPKTIANLGSRRIYTYEDLKVTFTDGRVTDVQ